MLLDYKTLMATWGDKLARPLTVEVRTYNYGRDTNGNKIAAYSAGIRQTSGALVPVAASGARRLQVGYQTGQHGGALLALDKAGYPLGFCAGVAQEGTANIARYAVLEGLGDE